MKDRLSRIGPQSREQHYYLRREHRCYFWGEYTPVQYTQGQGADFSETNRLIAALKTPILNAEPADLAAKAAAIEEVAKAFAGFWRWAELAPKVLLVPIPPSKPRSHPEYDDRMLRVAKAIVHHAGVDAPVVNAIEHDGTLDASHSAAKRPSLSTVRRKLRADHSKLQGLDPQFIFIFDDVITTGAHFVACCAALGKTFPNARFIGNFVARTKRLAVAP